MARRPPVVGKFRIISPFIGVKNIFLTERSAKRIARTLRESVGGEVTEVLAALYNSFIEEFQSSKPVQEGIGQ